MTGEAGLYSKKFRKGRLVISARFCNAESAAFCLLRGILVTLKKILKNKFPTLSHTANANKTHLSGEAFNYNALKGVTAGFVKKAT